MNTEKDKILILVVEDDPISSKLLTKILEEENFEVVNAFTGREGLNALNANNIDVILLDLNLPDMDGVEILKYIYKNPQFMQIAVLITSDRSDEIDVVIGFEFGADDYIQKPIRKRELIARIKANAGKKQFVIPFSPEIIKFGNKEFDFQNKQLRSEGEIVRLTSKEYYLLAFFLVNPNRIISRDEILKKIWYFNTVVDTRTVDVHVAMIREKIKDIDHGYIETIRGMGYRFNI